jgi:hypothetical protein
MEPSEVRTTRLTPEERARHYEELQRRTMLSAIYARHRDPNLYVRWVRDDKFDVATHRHLGFDFARDNPKVKPDNRRIDTVVPISEDGFYRTGDVILMEINRDDYEYYCNQNVERSRKMIDSGKDEFRNEARKRKVPTFTRDEGGHPQFDRNND